MQERESEDCTKKTVVIESENYYILVGDDFAMVTVPRENDPTMSKTRIIAETICSEISTELEKLESLKIASKHKMEGRLEQWCKVRYGVGRGRGDRFLLERYDPWS